MRRRQLNVIAVWLAFAAVAGLALLASSAPAVSLIPDRGPAERVCFDREAWSGNDRKRPCYVISHPHEDASGWLNIGTRRAPVRVTCQIPNWREESRRFAISCRR